MFADIINRTFLIVFSMTLLMLAYHPEVAVAVDEPITIGGDPCSLPLAKMLGEAFVAKNGGSIIGSVNKCALGVFRAANNEVDIGTSTQNGLSANLPRGAVNTVIAKSPIVLVVNKENPVTNLTYEQLKDIYAGDITNWKEVGGQDMEIKNVLLAPCVKHSMSKKIRPYSKHIAEIRPVKKGNPMTLTNKLVAENVAAVGQQIYGYHSANVKVLTIDGVLPDEMTLGQKYSFYQDLNIVTNGEPTGRLKGYIEFARSPEGRKIIESMNHIPVQ